jgi:hypothetical protein
MYLKTGLSVLLHCSENHIYVFPFLGIARPHSQFPHSCVCEKFIYSQDWSTYFLPHNRQIDCGNTSIAHRHLKWKLGLLCCGATPFLGIFVLNFRYWFFAVCFKK